MLKHVMLFTFLGLFSTIMYAQSNMRTTPTATKGLSERSIKPSTKPLSVKPAASQPKEVILEEVTISRTPRRMSPFRGEKPNNNADNSTENAKSAQNNNQNLNIRKNIASPQE